MNITSKSQPDLKRFSMEMIFYEYDNFKVK